MFTFLEFFAGGGMARAGLGPQWECLFSNDVDPKKTSVYAANWGDEALRVGDVADLRVDDLPRQADLAWASFPCQDLSLAGAGAGLDGGRSGAFWPFWSLMMQLAEQGRSPKVIVLENVMGALTANGGRDFAAILNAMLKAGYRCGAVAMDAVKFVPQSRPRLFIIGACAEFASDATVSSPTPLAGWHPQGIVDAQCRLPKTLRENWMWWRLPEPPAREHAFVDVIEDEPLGVSWHTKDQTRQLLAMMSPANLAKVKAATEQNRRVVGAIYKRTRRDVQTGEKVQRAEVRFDDIAGCLRTPAGGSSRQIIMLIEGTRIRSRLLSPREAARLMGLPDSYHLPPNYNAAYHLAGDGVVVPVVRFLAEHLLQPLIGALPRPSRKAA